jgi:putative hemolysin
VPVGVPAQIDGRLNLADFAERAGFALPAGPYETVGGFLMAALGRLPVRGDEVPVVGDPLSDREGGWVLRVLELDGRRISRVGISRAQLPEQRRLPVPVAGTRSVAVSGPPAGPDTASAVRPEPAPEAVR